ncbi:HMA domain-containing protein [Cephalotus follicularis]|uniref:HMA domain-containing protein n=1 Tax=Cephalotus follicularis TaxID=3775 RepID=A0A1Q3CKA7_CEPFO|nr:HMA domain-containing protein [Cephalotus follicularis]
MKGMDLFCASPASTAICSSIDQRAMVRHGHRPMDRQNSRPYAPCSSHLPIIPKPYHDKSRNHPAKQSDFRRKSSADTDDLRRPSGSSRYLLSEHSPFIDWISESDDSVSALIQSQPSKPRHVSSNDSTTTLLKSSSSRGSHDSPALRPSSSSRSSHSPALRPSSSSRSRDQVVVLKVSIHCKGCEGKVRKHISKMEGVTSFSIDLETKKVIVIGDVTPLSVLASVSRVKSAQLWPFSTSSSSLPSSPSIYMSN